MKLFHNIIVVPLHEIIDNIYKLLSQARSVRAPAFFVALTKFTSVDQERNTSIPQDEVTDEPVLRPEERSVLAFYQKPPRNKTPSRSLWHP